jgi:hypothetical protein
MSKIRPCGACGRKCIDVRFALVPGQLGKLSRKKVCRKCWSHAERIVTTATNAECRFPSCTDAAAICNHHHAAEVIRVRKHALSHARDELAGKLAAYAMTVPLEGSEDRREGIVQGLQMSLDVIDRPGPVTSRIEEATS